MFTCFAGELPKELGDLVNLMHFDASHNKFQGKLYVPSYMPLEVADIPLFCAGELPKELGSLVNLTDLRLYNNQFQGKLYVPSHIHARVACFA